MQQLVFEKLVKLGVTLEGFPVAAASAGDCTDVKNDLSLSRVTFVIDSVI